MLDGMVGHRNWPRLIVFRQLLDILCESSSADIKVKRTTRETGMSSSRKQSEPKDVLSRLHFYRECEIDDLMHELGVYIHAYLYIIIIRIQN